MPEAEAVAIYSWLVDRPPSSADLRADLATGWASRAEAENWLSLVYADLLADGLEDVTLLADGQPLYTMSLRTDDAGV